MCIGQVSIYTHATFMRKHDDLIMSTSRTVTLIYKWCHVYRFNCIPEPLLGIGVKLCSHYLLIPLFALQV